MISPLLNKDVKGVLLFSILSFIKFKPYELICCSTFKY